jgi:hypothetical protein
MSKSQNQLLGMSFRYKPSREDSVFTLRSGEGLDTFEGKRIKPEIL